MRSGECFTIAFRVKNLSTHFGYSMSGQRDEGACRMERRILNLDTLNRYPRGCGAVTAIGTTCTKIGLEKKKLQSIMGYALIL